MQLSGHAINGLSFASGLGVRKLSFSGPKTLPFVPHPYGQNMAWCGDHDCNCRLFCRPSLSGVDIEHLPHLKSAPIRRGVYAPVFERRAKP